VKLFKYYRDAVIYPSLFVLLFSFVYSVLYCYTGTSQLDSDYLVTSLVTSLLYLLLMYLLSLTIFLNKIKKFSRNILFNILSWYLLPACYIVLVYAYDMTNRIKYNFGYGTDFLHLLIMTAPFIIGLYVSFSRYRKNVIVLM
jgi:hypothetical protein